jgi:hypothetical protein
MNDLKRCQPPPKALDFSLSFGEARVFYMEGILRLCLSKQLICFAVLSYMNRDATVYTKRTKACEED